MHSKDKPSILDTKFPKATLTEFKGVIYLHLGTDWIQGAMRMGDPNVIVLEYVQQMMMWMLFEKDPKHIVQLGLGSAALTKFCYQHFQEAKITAVELNPYVISTCHNVFSLPPNDERLTVLHADAVDFIQKRTKKPDIDILQIDLFDENAESPVYDSAEFYEACANRLTENGMLTVNLFGNEQYDFKDSIENMEKSFDAVVWLPKVHEVNTIAIAFKKAPSIDFSILYQRASEIRRTCNFNPKSWVDGLVAWMNGEVE